jgi:diguanylate cyclase (GGDEF)-like protein
MSGSASPEQRRKDVAVEHRRTVVPVLGLVLAVTLIGYVDYLTGPEIGFSLFYLPAIVVAGWYYGREASVVVAIIAAASWFIADYLVRVSLSISLWNGLTRLVIYASQGVLVAMLREDRLREATLARTDTVTNLANSRAFLELLHGTAHSSDRVSVMYIDLDNFKRVNDLFGHGKGDLILERTAVELRASIRASDIAARVGGDEFAVLLKNIDTQVAEEIASRFLASVRLLAREVDGADFGASVGFAIGDGRLSPDELLKAADDAMYDAKQRQKGSFAIRTLQSAEPKPDDTSRTRRLIARVTAITRSRK